MVSLESEILRLREDSRALAEERGDLQARVQILQQSKEAEEARAKEERNRLISQMQSFEREAKEAAKASAQARRRLLKLQQELGVLRAERDFHRSTARRKVNNKTPRVDASSRTHMLSTENRMDSPAKDDWEDMSADRYFPHLSLSLSLSHSPSFTLSLFS